MSENVASFTTEDACPYGTLGLNEAECRHVPARFGGVLNSPFVISSPDDPAGCFGFRRWTYFNDHPIGSSRRNRRLYCKRSNSWLRFQRLSQGACADYGFLSVRQLETCEAAARELGLAGIHAHITNSSRRPEGCYYFANPGDGTGTLWLSVNPLSAGKGAETSPGAPSWIRQPICMAQTTTMPPFSTAAATTARPVSGSYVAGSKGANECPYGAAALNQSECRLMPGIFGGRLHDPLVVDSPGDPRGCFFLSNSYYFNANSKGAARAGRRPYCKISGVGLGRGCGSACDPVALHKRS